MLFSPKEAIYNIHLNRKNIETVDEPVRIFYRTLLRSGFQHAGSLESPSIFLDSIGEKIAICTQSARYYIHLYIDIRNDIVENIKYLCICDPVSNVAVEVLCSLVKGKMLNNVRSLSEDAFSQVVGGISEDLLKSARGLLELLNRGIARYQGEKG
jgi:NifU-like protein involved in Fe-S cluster formation